MPIREEAGVASDKNVERDRGDRGDRGGSQKMKKVGTGGPGTASGANGLALHLSGFGGFFPRRLLLPGPVVHATLIAFTSAARSSTSLPCVRRSLREACGCETRANRTCTLQTKPVSACTHTVRTATRTCSECSAKGVSVFCIPHPCLACPACPGPFVWKLADPRVSPVPPVPC